MSVAKDRLGYDTRDLNYIKQMARDALTGRNEAAVDAEVAAVEKTLGLKPKPMSLRRRIERWVSHRYWRARFWIEDRIKR